MLRITVFEKQSQIHGIESHNEVWSLKCSL